MATIVNNPPSTTDTSGGMGFVLGIIVLLLAAFLFMIYGLPMISRSLSTPQVSVPDKINVDVNTPNAGTSK